MTNEELQKAIEELFAIETLSDGMETRLKNILTGELTREEVWAQRQKARVAFGVPAPDSRWARDEAAEDAALKLRTLRARV